MDSRSISAIRLPDLRLECLAALDSLLRNQSKSPIESFYVDLADGDCAHQPERTQIWVDSMLRMRRLNGLYRKSQGPCVRTGKIRFSHSKKLDESRIRYHQLVEMECRAAKYVIDCPREFMSPSSLGGFIQKRAARLGVKCEAVLLNGKQGVATARIGAASEYAPTILHLDYDGASSGPRSNIWLCGKGVTMDTGGIALKSQGGMRMMKTDMAGAATVAGAIFAAARLRLPVRVNALLAIAENMVGPKSLLPGDLLRYPNGITVEVTDTDAEGRLMLADLCLIAKGLDAKAIVSVGTLTEVVSWVIGRWRAGLQATDAALADRIVDAGLRSGEPAWVLPIGAEHARDLDSDWVDLVNSSGPSYGPIQPPVFLQKFCGNTPFAHMEISGPAFLSEWGGTCATGFGVGLLVEFIRSYAAMEEQATC